MTTAATVHVPSGTLRWARERAAASVVDAAHRCDRDPDEIAAWEDGTVHPPLTALRELASLYGVPLSALLLSHPPRKSLPTVDRRTYSGVDVPETTMPLAKALHRAADLQEVARAVIEHADGPRFEAMVEDIEADQLATDQRRAFNISVAQQRTWRDDNMALRAWRTAIERRGVFVLQVSMPKTEVRAFSLSEHPPFIVLNRSDHVRARVFSLLHEFCHVLLGSAGICLPSTSRRAMQATEPERYCNVFAGAFLVPSDALRADADAQRIGAAAAVPDDAPLERIGRRFHVSRGVVWFRLYQVGLVSQAIFTAKWDDWADWFPAVESGGGPTTSADIVMRDYGAGLASLLMAAKERGVLTSTDVAQYLVVPQAALPSVEAAAAQRLAG